MVNQRDPGAFNGALNCFFPIIHRLIPMSLVRGCEHQQMVSKVSDCTDVSGDIRQDDCTLADFGGAAQPVGPGGCRRSMVN